MATREAKTAGNQTMARASKARCLPIARTGIKTGRDFASFMSALMSDLIQGTVSPGVGNAACNAGGKLLKVVEMEQKYGTNEMNTAVKTKVLNLAIGA